MPRPRRRKSLGTKLLVILLAAVLVPSVVLTYVLIEIGAQAQRREAVSLLEEANRGVSDALRDFVSDIDSILTSVGLFHAFADRDLGEQVQTLDNILQRFQFFQGLGVYYGPDKPFSAVSGGRRLWNPPEGVIRTGFTQAIRGGTYISPIHYTSAGQALVLIMAPISSPGQAPIGVVAGIASLDRAQDIADRFSAGRRQVLIVDQSGRALGVPASYARAKPGSNLVGLEAVERLVSNPTGPLSSGSLIYRDSNGTRMLAVFSHAAGPGWGVVVQEPAGMILGTPYGSIATALLWMALFVLLFALLGAYVSFRITGPLARLREGAEIIGAGDFQYRVNVRTGDELEELADSFNRTAANLATSYQELEREHVLAIRAARQADTLYSVSQALVSTLRLDERLDLVAQSLAEVCDTDRVGIWLLRGGTLVPTASFGLLSDEKDAFDRWKVHLQNSTAMTREVAVSKKPVVIRDASSDPRIPAKTADRFNVKSVLALPLLLEDEVIGYAVTYQVGTEREFTDYHISMAKAIAAQAAVAIQNAEAYERERHIADTLQRSFLPQVPPRIDAFEIADMYESALTEAEIGGDFYDLVQFSPTRIGFVMADISGKGLSAAVHTAMIKYMLRAYTLEDLDSCEMMRRLNSAVWKYIGNQLFITLFYGVLDTETRELRYVNAGHELPFLYGEQRGICTRLMTTGTALGIVPEYQYGEECIEFMPGDALLLYTDGATDVRREAAFLGEDGLEGIFCGASSGTARQIVDAVDAGIRDYSSGQLHDDVALLVIKYLGEERAEDGPG